MSERDTDLLLVERVQSGDQRAFELLVKKYQRKIFRLLSRFFKDQAEIEDVMQESFIRAYRALPNFRGDSAFYTWLYRIAINTAKNHLLAQRRRPLTVTEFENDEGETFSEISTLSDGDTPETQMSTRQIAETVSMAIEELSDDLKQAITLREIDGLSYEEIAEIMDCPLGTVRSRIYRAREAIALKLRPLLDTETGARW